jgi:purine-binding chemotaxis protein CheW
VTHATPQRRDLIADRAAADQARILQERARVLARPVHERPGDQWETEMVLFGLARETYAIESSHIREVFPLRDLTPIPCTPPFVLGIINVRGEMCPAVDLKRLLGLPESGLTNATRAVILHDEGKELAVVVDVVFGVSTVATRHLAPPPPVLSGLGLQFLRGVTADQVAVLDAASILSHPDMIVNEQVDG